MITVDLGWGALSAGTPTHTALSVRIMDDGTGSRLQNEPTELQDGTYFQIETPTTYEYKIKFYKRNYADNAASAAAIKNILKFMQGQPKWIRMYSELWTLVHPGNPWVQVFIPAKDMPFPRKSNLYAFEFPLCEFTPIDNATL